MHMNTKLPVYALTTVDLKCLEIGGLLGGVACPPLPLLFWLWGERSRDFPNCLLKEGQQEPALTHPRGGRRKRWKMSLTPAVEVGGRGTSSFRALWLIMESRGQAARHMRSVIMPSAHHPNYLHVYLTTNDPRHMPSPA